MKTKLTISKIEKLQTKKEVLWDTDVHGLHARSLKTGVYFYLYYRNAQGQQRKPSLGRYGSITLDQARQKARSWWHLINQGGDPSIEKRENRLQSNLPTVQDLKNRWEKEHAKDLKSRQAMLNMWENKILPKIGSKKIKDVVRRDIESALETTGGLYQYNRVRALLAKAFNLAEEWGWRDESTNPCRHIKKKKESARHRYMTPSEITALGSVLSRWDRKEGLEFYFANLIKLLIITGARCGEIMKAKWEFMNWDRQVLELPDSKTGRKEIILSEYAIAIICDLYKRKINDWVIPGRNENQPLKNPQKPWKRLLKEADLENLRIHDLRHTYASTAMSSASGSLPQIGALLGHSQASTTQRYAHFMTDPKRKLANETSEIIEEWLTGSLSN